MKTFEFSIPGNVGYELIQAEDLKQAQAIADSMCVNHSFLGGELRPLVTEVNRKIVR